MLQSVLMILIAYLFGAIPFGYVLTKKLTNQNILEYGSGNIGSTNVKRIAGKRLALVTQVLDILKGLFPVALVLLLQKYYVYPFHDYVVYLTAFAAILGHNHSVFLRFKGGKGVNTTIGASLLITTVPVLIAITVFFLVKWRFKYVSLGSIMLGITLPVSGYFLYGFSSAFVYLMACFLFIIVRHRANIRRLLKGEENR